MVFSYYVFYLPYTCAWYLYKLFKKQEVVFYCAEPLDHFIFEPVSRYLRPIKYVTDNIHTRDFLRQRNIPFQMMPVFPKAVIMARHSLHKFPCRRILKVGMRHGAYHFKRFTSTKAYNQFHLYLMTSQRDVEEGKKVGIVSAKAIGFPKLDPAFNGIFTEEYLKNLRNRYGLSQDKPVVLFTATYDASGMSAVKLWYDRLSFLTKDYQLLVTLHPWLESKYKQVIQNTPDVYMIEDYNILPYIMIADVCVGDTSSILAECCALDKPIITWQVDKAKRSLDEIEQILDSISYRISSFVELTEALSHAITHKDELANQRNIANIIFFDKLDGKAGQRAAQAICNVLPELNKDS